MTSKELTTITRKLSPIMEKAMNFHITDDSSLKHGVKLLSELNQFNDRIVLEREKVTKPLNEALKAERARWKPIELENLGGINLLRSRMTQYQTNLVNEQKAKERQIADRVSRGTLKIETGIKKLENIQTVETEHSTAKGLVQFVSIQTLKVTNLDSIPREYFNLDESKVLKDLKLGVKIPGAEIEVIQQPRNYR